MAYLMVLPVAQVMYGVYNCAASSSGYVLLPVALAMYGVYSGAASSTG
jgi:hypothetical protein